MITIHLLASGLYATGCQYTETYFIVNVTFQLKLLALV